MTDILDKTILITDDNKLFLNSCENILTVHFKVVFFACNGQEALEILRKNHVDLVVLDLDMPVMTGDELLTIIKNDPALKDVYVYTLSSLLRDESAEDECLGLDSTSPETERGKKVEETGKSKGKFDMSQKKEHIKSWTSPGDCIETDEMLFDRQALGLVDKIYEIFGKEKIYNTNKRHDEEMRSEYNERKSHHKKLLNSVKKRNTE